MAMGRPGLWQRMVLALSRKLDLVGDPRLLVGERGVPVRNAPSPFPVFARFLRARLRAKKRRAPAESAEEFRRRVERALSGLEGAVKRVSWHRVPANSDAWQSTGVRLDAGEEVTVLAHGELFLSKPLDVSIGPQVGLWFRIGDGTARKLTRASQVLRAETPGALAWMASLPGEFADPHGHLDPALSRKSMQGAFTVAVIAWSGSTAEGLAAAARADAALFAPILACTENPRKPPEGWRYLWRIGEGEVFTPCDDDGRAAIRCRTNRDVGILQFPVDHDFAPDLTLAWSWLVERLPSELAEHIQPTHDYLSIAIEFENGLDLTYMWSAELPVDTIFQCPLAWWDQRETHWVVRSDPADRGRWLAETRNVYEDYARAIGGPLPKKVVAVWLIANAAFQRGQGDCRYRGITVEGGGRRTQVHP